MALDEDIMDAIRNHVEDHHLGLPKEEIQEAFDEHNTLLDVTREIIRKLDMVLDDYFGVPYTNVDGEVERGVGTREANSIMFKRMDERQAKIEVGVINLEGRMNNGGVPAKVKLTKPQKWGIAAVIFPSITASLGFLAAAINYLGS